MHHDHVGFIPGMQGVFKISNQSMWYTTLNNWRLKNMIISDAEKAFDNSEHPFMIKTLQNVGTEGTCLNVKVQVAQSCLILCNPMYYAVHGILQARTLNWVAFPFSRGSSQPRNWTQVFYIAGEFFTSWATREALPQCNKDNKWQTDS